MKKIFSLFLLLLSFYHSNGQKIVTAGFQLRYIVPNELTTRTVVAQNDQIELTNEASGGYGIGMHVRYVLNERWALDGGMNLAVRKFNYIQRDLQEGYRFERPYQLNAFELPVAVLVNAQLSPKSFLNASAGFQLDVFATEVKFNERFEERIEDYVVTLPRRALLNASGVAGLGYEFRSRENGIFYAGMSYHLPFQSVYLARTQYIRSSELFQIDYELIGDYLSLDFRYYFPQNNKK